MLSLAARAGMIAQSRGCLRRLEPAASSASPSDDRGSGARRAGTGAPDGQGSWIRYRAIDHPPWKMRVKFGWPVAAVSPPSTTRVVPVT